MWGSEQSMLNRFNLGLDLIDWSVVGKWLDLGCGAGRFFQVAEQTGHCFDMLTGVDITQSLITQAQARHFNSPTRFQTSDLETLPDTPADIDLVTFVGVLQLCGCPLETAIKVGVSRLKPGGQVFLTTKHLGWKSFEDDGLIPDPEHSWFTYDDVRHAVEASGLDIIEARGFLPADNQIVNLEDSHTLYVYAKKRH